MTVYSFNHPCSHHTIAGAIPCINAWSKECPDLQTIIEQDKKEHYVTFIFPGGVNNEVVQAASLSTFQREPERRKIPNGITRYHKVTFEGHTTGKMKFIIEAEVTYASYDKEKTWQRISRGVGSILPNVSLPPKPLLGRPFNPSR